MQKRKFYIIAHNPNTLQQAEEFLKAGANALEPDICFDAGCPNQSTSKAPCCPRP